ncbi:MAG: WecB/TagA/CpsF family glycosyltransferase [Nitrospirae bacterium]|nr:WecB/TagA/CpsF family glycosyltransferase [Nitrospirota bacterium]
MKGIERKNILGVPVDLIDMEGAIRHINDLIAGNSRNNYIFAINAEKVMALQKDSFLRQMAENASLLIPDGIGAVLALKLLYGKRAKRVPGVDLMHNICREAAEKGYKIFIYGAKEEINKKSVEKLHELYDGIKIVGRSHGYVTSDKMDYLLRQINESGADILFIALGSPKQEKWIQEYLPKLNVKVCQGIGGTLDTIVGIVKRAPESFQRLGLEWFYRLLKEPKRIRRQLVLPLFILKVLREKMRR